MNDWTRLLCATTALASVAIAAPAFAAGIDQRATFEIAAGSLDEALIAYSRQADVQVISASVDLAGKRTRGVTGDHQAREALALLLQDSGLSFVVTGEHTVTVAQDPQGGSAGGGAEGNAVEALIVTAQKREENIQDVPIAISAFTQQALEEQKIEGGFDLMKAIPNVTFSKSNFSSYNFSIRGVGTKAISATTDPGVSVSFNNTGLIQNRLFEQEYFDVERVEVLRGPQGTLYGRNATSGVINVISAKPRLGGFEGSAKAEIGNYDTQRLVGMLNIPIVNDVLAVRLAGSMTQRTGYDYNSVTEHNINGRDLWSGRVTVGFEPTPAFRANLIWEHFEEDDDRSRTGKQLCHRDPGLQVVGNTQVVVDQNDPKQALLRPALFSQGCLPGGLYDDAAFNTPNGLALPFMFAPLALGYGNTASFHIGFEGSLGNGRTIIQLVDPYGGLMQSPDLRTIASFRDPVYRAKADVVELNMDFDITDSLTLSSQTAYNKDEVYSFQDFNRFNTFPVFTDTTTLIPLSGGDWSNLAPGGVFCDPQLGCSDTIAGFDISQASGSQFSQELRLQSSFDGPVNFSAGANYTRFKTLIDYYVFYNLITALTLTRPFYIPVDGNIDLTTCAYTGSAGTFTNPPVPIDSPEALCPYIDPNPIESIDGEGHNYFRSKNPYKLKSWAAFGEFYWNITDALKLTAGLRYTDDTKTFIPVPSQVLMGPGAFLGGTVNKGYPEKPPIVQQWGEWTGRLGVDWKPELSFTEETMLYAFYSRGYKGGGANPPSPGFAELEEQTADLIARGANEAFVLNLLRQGLLPTLQLSAVEYGRTFEPEFVNAFEVGAKSTLLQGAMTLNMGAFYYDYRDYQVSQIRDRTAVNENFDATIWGLEFETVFAPSRNLRIIANLGYLDTEIADGETSIDIMNRTQGNPAYVLAKPWPQLPSNCVVPVAFAEAWLQSGTSLSNYQKLCGVGGILGVGGRLDDPATGADYDVNNYPELNGGAGLKADLSGNELPNSPHWTTNIGAQYGFDFAGSWRATVRGDAYWQSQSFHRVYNTEPYDKLHGWYNANLSVWVEQPDWGLKVELYAKNILDATPITDAFLNSDDTALTTNVFVLDPRLIGFSVRKEF